MIEDVLAQSVGVVVILKFLPFAYGEDLISPNRSVQAESGTKSRRSYHEVTISPSERKQTAGNICRVPVLSRLSFSIPPGEVKPASNARRKMSPSGWWLASFH